ncbi:winged helix-turn-helix transcriptional regulator [Deinococcus peraridilitoris]|uniref:Putative transcriptional regulator n=1 Tax=Deinococcus peraridilitoris (strain DSM 19664 / LMG 22246 / CIP 109416 / KR-200) TaxID=937777 RepID=L0A7P6_DEIPD|nr:winged helix-turn-helix transcriptional regulator [Deinococcus peraridilitoris]AFZ69192.1 putative transcriptional regulator [Deinococcus peraridilitoris DSM 19664]
MECKGADAAAAAVELLQRKHVLPIIHALLAQPYCFNALQRAVHAPSAATLRDRLKALLAVGVIRRDDDTYHLTAAGYALQPVFDALSAFTAAHPQHDPAIVLDALQRRHAMPIMRELRQRSMGFNELQRALGAPSATTLTRRIIELQQIGLIFKTAPADSTVPGQYRHSPFGADFSPVVGCIVAWGIQHLRNARRSASSDEHAVAGDGP